MFGKRNIEFATRVAGGTLFLLAAASLVVPSSSGAAERLAYIAVGEVARPPIG